MRRKHSRYTIADLCDFINGHGFTPSDWKTSGLPIIRIQNLNGTTSFNYYDGPTKPDWIVEPGDLLYAWAGVKGVSFGPTIWPGPKGVLNQHIYKVVPRANIDRYWLYLVLKHVTGKIEEQAHGFKSSLVHVHKEDITGQAIELPPFDEQRQIAALLGTWNQALQKLESLRAAKVQRRDSIAQRLLARVHSRGRLRSNGWKKSSFGAVFTERQDRNYGLGSEAVVTVGKYAIQKQSEHFTRSVASSDLSNYWTISPGDFVYDPMSAYYGALGQYTGDSDGIVSPAYRVIQLSEAVLPAFMVYLLKSHRVKFLLETRSSQGNKEGKRRLLQRDEFANIDFLLPPMEEQRRIARTLCAFEKDLQVTGALIQAVMQQKRGLMQKLLTGEWRVRP